MLLAAESLDTKNSGIGRVAQDEALVAAYTHLFNTALQGSRKR